MEGKCVLEAPASMTLGGGAAEELRTASTTAECIASVVVQVRGGAKGVVSQ